MGRLLRALLALTGLLALVLGGVAAAALGPDDTLYLQPVRPDAEPGRPVVTAPDLLTFRRLTLVVRAEADQEVFLGAGNPVDVTDLASQVEHVELTEIRRSSVVGRSRPAAADRPAPLPGPAGLAGAVGWHAKAYGRAPVEIRTELTGAPVQLLIAPSAEEIPTLRFGAQLDGLFGVLVGLGLGGAAVLALAATLMVRAGRRRRSPEQGAAGQQPGSPGDPARPPGRGERRVATAVATGLVLALVPGCGYVPERVAPAIPVKVALEEDELGPLLESYDARRNRAQRAAERPRYRAHLWRRVDAGPALDADVYATALAAGLRSRRVTTPVRSTAERVYSPTLARYPLWALAVSRTEGGEPRGREQTRRDRREQARRRTIGVFVREHAASPWLRQTTGTVLLRDLPAATTPSPPEDRLGEARRAVRAATRYFTRGRSRGIEMDREARRFRSSTRVAPGLRRFVQRIEVSVGPVLEADAVDPLRVVRVEGGRLAVSLQAMRVTMVVRANAGELSWARGYDRVNGESGPDLYHDYTLNLVIFLPDSQSRPRVISTALMPTIA